MWETVVILSLTLFWPVWICGFIIIGNGWLTLISIVYIFLFVMMVYDPGENENMLNNFALKIFINRLNVNYIGNTSLTEKQKIFAFHSHGQIAIGQMHASVFKKGSKSLKHHMQNTIPLVSTIIIGVPIIRQISRSLGCQSATKETVEQLLKEGQKNISLSVGGAREIMYSPKNEKDIERNIVRRTGFLRIAFRYKTAVVPILVNEKECCYNTLFQGTKLQKFMLRMVNYPAPSMMYGDYMLLPRKNNKTEIIIGKDLTCKEGETENVFIDRYYRNLTELANSNGISVKYVDEPNKRYQ